MKKYKLKFKILAHGFPATVNKFQLDDFDLKSETIHEKEITNSLEKDSFNTTGYITTCSYKLDNDNSLYYNFFENHNFIEMNVPNDKTKSKASLGEHVLKSQFVQDIVCDLEKKMRLVFNLRIIFPIYKVFIFDENENQITYIINYKDFPANIGLFQFDTETFEKNSHFNFNLKSIKLLEKKNIRFSRAMDLFTHSFDPSNVSLRFLMLFSTLESLFITSKTDVTKNLAICVSKILLYDNTYEEEKIYQRIKELYKFRSKYVHGKNTEITVELEKELRNYVRQVLIIYWMISQNSKYTSNTIISTLKSNGKIDLQVKLTAKYLRADDYTLTYKETCLLIARELKNGNLKINKEEDG